MALFYFNKIQNKQITLYVIKFLGIKISFKYFQDIGIINKLLFPIKKIIFRKRHEKYINRKNKTEIKRLFLTTGNLSLINSIAIIKQLNLEEKSKNDILIWSHISNSDFEKVNKEITKFVKINNYYTFYGKELLNGIQYFVKHMLYDYDEIYFVNLNYMIVIVDTLFPKAKWFITEEGICTLNKIPLKKEAEKYIFNNYLYKLDLLCNDKSILDKLIRIDKKEFLNISKKCETKYPLDIKLNREDKNIIFCGTYSIIDYWSLEEIINMQNDIIQKLIAKGYKVIFKPHPRDNIEYKENESFQILKTKLPLECYSIGDKCLAVVSLSSSASCQMYYFQGIAGFCCTEMLKNTNFNIIKEYSPNVKMLLDIDTKLKTFEELRNEILSIYTNFLATKLLLSENKNINNIGKVFKE